ncbi:hypothetical protein D3C81_1015560 [compost metagenome]
MSPASASDLTRRSSPRSTNLPLRHCPFGRRRHNYVLVSRMTPNSAAPPASTLSFGDAYASGRQLPGRSSWPTHRYSISPTHQLPPHPNPVAKVESAPSVAVRTACCPLPKKTARSPPASSLPRFAKATLPPHMDRDNPSPIGRVGNVVFYKRITRRSNRPPMLADAPGPTALAWPGYRPSHRGLRPAELPRHNRSIR